MYIYNKNHIEINNNKFDFEYDIRNIIQYNENYIVLLAIPFNKNDINNIYCLDDCANLVWQSENLEQLYPETKNLPYEQMGIKGNIIFATDFYGRSYKINAENGSIMGCDIVR